MINSIALRFTPSTVLASRCEKIINTDPDAPLLPKLRTVIDLLLRENAAIRVKRLVFFNVMALVQNQHHFLSGQDMVKSIRLASKIFSWSWNTGKELLWTLYLVDSIFALDLGKISQNFSPERPWIEVAKYMLHNSRDFPLERWVELFGFLANWLSCLSSNAEEEVLKLFELTVGDFKEQGRQWDLFTRLLMGPFDCLSVKCRKKLVFKTCNLPSVCLEQMTSSRAFFEEVEKDRYLFNAFLKELLKKAQNADALISSEFRGILRFLVQSNWRKVFSRKTKQLLMPVLKMSLIHTFKHDVNRLRLKECQKIVRFLRGLITNRQESGLCDSIVELFIHDLGNQFSSGREEALINICSIAVEISKPGKRFIHQLALYFLQSGIESLSGRKDPYVFTSLRVEQQFGDLVALVGFEEEVFSVLIGYMKHSYYRDLYREHLPQVVGLLFIRMLKEKKEPKKVMQKWVKKILTEFDSSRYTANLLLHILRSTKGLKFPLQPEKLIFRLIELPLQTDEKIEVIYALIHRVKPSAKAKKELILILAEEIKGLGQINRFLHLVYNELYLQADRVEVLNQIGGVAALSKNPSRRLSKSVRSRRYLKKLMPVLCFLKEVDSEALAQATSYLNFVLGKRASAAMVQWIKNPTNCEFERIALLAWSPKDKPIPLSVFVRDLKWVVSAIDNRIVKDDEEQKHLLYFAFTRILDISKDLKGAISEPEQYLDKLYRELKKFGLLIQILRRHRPHDTATTNPMMIRFLTEQSLKAIEDLTQRKKKVEKRKKNCLSSFVCKDAKTLLNVHAGLHALIRDVIFEKIFCDLEMGCVTYYQSLLQGDLNYTHFFLMVQCELGRHLSDHLVATTDQFSKFGKNLDLYLDQWLDSLKPPFCQEGKRVVCKIVVNALLSHPNLWTPLASRVLVKLFQKFHAENWVSVDDLNLLFETYIQKKWITLDWVEWSYRQLRSGMSVDHSTWSKQKLFKTYSCDILEAYCFLSQLLKANCPTFIAQLQKNFIAIRILLNERRKNAAICNTRFKMELDLIDNDISRVRSEFSLIITDRGKKTLEKKLKMERIQSIKKIISKIEKIYGDKINPRLLVFHLDQVIEFFNLLEGKHKNLVLK